MEQVYVIAMDVFVYSNGKRNVETRVLHKLGAFVFSADAQARCEKLIEQEKEEVLDSTEEEDVPEYYVKELKLK